MKSIASILFTLCIYSSSTASTASGSKSTNHNNFISAGGRYRSTISNHNNDIPRSTNQKNYSSGLNIVNDTNNNNEEYVTNFYHQKRLAKRRDLAATAAKNSVEATASSCANDHSLDHYYFNHHYKRPVANSEQQPHAPRVASSVRGGSISQQRQLRNNRRTNYNNHRHGEGNHRRQPNHSRKNHPQRHYYSQQKPSSSSMSSSAAFVPRHRRGGHSQSKQQYQRHDSMLLEEESDVDEFHNLHRDIYDLTDVDCDEEYDEDDYSKVQEYDDTDDDTAANNNNSMTPHQAGLLRLPCRLRLNSDETSYNHYHHHSHTNNNKFKSSSSSTPIAAYIDTGAQVTVISASAARKIGILHLMDRRYAGRATGVGSCRILGRIPAGCVQFVLGGRNQHYHDNNNKDEGIEMNGPALTVLEGTVTKGVDMLVGLDVLQEWEATIRMGGCGRSSSIAVRKRGRKDPVVLPFLVSDGGNNDGGGGRIQRRRRMSTNNPRRDGGGKRRQQQQQQRGTAAKSSSSFHDDYNRRQQQQKKQDMVAQQQQIVQDEQEENDNDDDDFSPISSDIESDLDILDQSEFTHGFPENNDARRRRTKTEQCSDEKIVQDIEREDELLGVRHNNSQQHYLCDEREDDEFLQDSSDEGEEDEILDFDMSGL